VLWTVHIKAVLLCRDLNRLDKWADKNLIKFSKGKHQTLCLGIALCTVMLGTDQLKGSLADKALVF